MLDKFDNTHVTDLLDTTADFRPEMMKSLDWDDIRKSLVRANGGRDMGDKFTHNLERFNLILLVYHTDALNVRVRIWSEQDSRKAIIDLYDAIMAASIGKDRLIVPQDLNEAGRLKYHSNVPLVADTWALFIDAFSRLGELDRVVKVIAEDIPLRYDGRPPSEDLLSSALKGMGYLATDTRFDRKLRKEASKQCDLLWETMVKAGMQSAKTIGRRMVALPSGRAGEIEKLYKAGLASLRQQQISGQDIYLDMAFFTHLCSTNQVDRAVRLLATRRQTDSKEERSLFQVMVRNALTEPLPYRERQRLYRALMKHKLPSARVYSGTYGIILRYLLEGNSDLQTACRMICAHSAESEPINWYMNLMLGLLVRGYREPSPRDFDAAVFILTTLVPRLDNAPQFKYLNLWRVAARSVAQATTIPAHERHEHLVALLDSFPGRKHYLDILRRNVIRYSASRNDAQGIPEALHHYKVLDKQVDGPLDYRVLIEYLVKHGQPQLAQEVVDDMPRDWRYGFVRAMARRLGLDVEGAVGFASAAEDTASAAEVAFQERVEEAEEEEDAEEGAVQSAREFGV
ncbi:hypothetical protein Q8F55_003990 [Vanrija albida]|uniref:Uncharacterized protein n=1 Tax=Vanrija albida TaxID=181172 RepID=A0ABR3Q5I0_9TREE